MAYFYSYPTTSFTDPFFSDPFFGYPTLSDHSLENRIVNTLDNIFSNNLVESQSTKSKQPSTTSSESPSTPKTTSTTKTTSTAPSSDNIVDKKESQKEMTISDWINNYKVFNPNIDFSENEKNYLVHADLPGMKKEDVKLDLCDGVLTISGERKNEINQTSEDHQCYRIERNFGKFKRSFVLPEDIDETGIQAKMEDGVLEINLNKKALPKKQTTKIEIQ